MSLLSYVAGLSRSELRRVALDMKAMEWPRSIPEEYQPLWWHGVNGLPDEALAQRVYALIDTIEDHIEGELRIRN
jgi:hypothetical protein